jgi:hypothetical protein
VKRRITLDDLELCNFLGFETQEPRRKRTNSKTWSIGFLSILESVVLRRDGADLPPPSSFSSNSSMNADTLDILLENNVIYKIGKRRCVAGG